MFVLYICRYKKLHLGKEKKKVGGGGTKKKNFKFNIHPWYFSNKMFDLVDR